MLLAWYKTAVTPLVTHWSYCSLALRHWYSVHTVETMTLVAIYIYIILLAYNNHKTHLLSSIHLHTIEITSSTHVTRIKCFGGENLCKQRLLTYWGDKMAAIFQTTFSNGFSWMKIYEFWLTFHWSLFLWVQLTIFQHWSVPSHYLNQWWLDYRRIYASLGLNESIHWNQNEMSSILQIAF